MLPVEALAQRWLAQDRDSGTRKEIEDLLVANDVEELERRLRHRIAFGTAGLRASMKAGFAHMNALTVLQASEGLAQYVIEQQASDSRDSLQIAVGHDARHNSQRFASLASASFLHKGLTVVWLGLVHTPMVPFAIETYAADAGVMITASHNPKNDNGYKVYWDNGCQIIPPHDSGIADAIDAVNEVSTWDDSMLEQHENVKWEFVTTATRYGQMLRALVNPLPESLQALSFAYTPMHGVGLPYMKSVARFFEHRVEMHIVQAQAEPDPEFPTVPFPNPEEKGALAPAIADADRNDCSLILANDPDADRFAAVERLPNGRWHQFTGNQMGVLLASHVLDSSTGDKSKLAMLASTVSSRMLAVMAKQEGFHFEETLTGFKWLGNVAQRLQREGLDPEFAYEEAIGYMFSMVVWDKDGIAAAAVFLKACLAWKQQGLTPWTRLQQLYAKYGCFEDANTYLISPTPPTTNKVFADIRHLNAGTRPESIGKRRILRWRDLTLGFDSGTPDNKPGLPVDPSAQMITCELENVVFTARGSGTEPKIKLYIEAQADEAEAARAIADEVLQDLLSEWFKSEYGLRLAGT